MKQIFKSLIIGSVMLLPGMGSAIAQDEESKGLDVIPVELYLCNYNEGKGSGDLDKWSDKWNAWADSTAPAAYSAWTLTPFYYGENQDFDFIWLGVSPDATTLGRAYDNYISNSGSLQPEFESIANCGAHSNYATMTVKPPPEDESDTSFVLSFSDCKVAEGKSFGDVHPALQAWSEYKAANGSAAGMWVMWAAYGGGGSEFDFKFVVSHANFESLGVDYDQFSKEGYEKSAELFDGLLDCDESRSYLATQRRDGMSEDG